MRSIWLSFRNIGILALLICQGALRAEANPQFHERLAWDGAKGARFILEYWARSEKPTTHDTPTECVLRTRLTRSLGGRRQTWEGHDTPTECVLRTRLTRSLGGRRQTWEGRDVFQDPHWAQIDLAVAVHVDGQSAPQILVQRSRSNWGDYLLYRVDEHGLTKAFHFSYRDEECIRWIAAQGRLQRFVAIDRYETRNRPAEPVGKRWQKRLVYRYDPKRQNWRAVSERWETYVFTDEDNGMHNPVFQHPHDCPFRFVR